LAAIAARFSAADRAFRILYVPIKEHKLPSKPVSDWIGENESSELLR
jgi:hypothetical protein